MSAERIAALAELGEAIRRRRREMRQTQDALARDAGMQRTYLGAIERGEINPTYLTLLRLSSGLQVPIERLIADARKHAG